MNMEGDNICSVVLIPITSMETRDSAHFKVDDTKW